MEALQVICTIIYLLVCIGLVVVVMFQNSKDSGLSAALTGSTNSYWSQNKGRSKEGKLRKITVILAVIFFVLTVVLNFSVMQ